MFGFKKKQTQEDPRKIIDIAVSLIQIQAHFGSPTQDKESCDKLVSQYARGYIFGVCDALLQSAGVTSYEKGFVPLLLIHEHLYDDGATVLKQ